MPIPKDSFAKLLSPLPVLCCMKCSKSIPLTRVGMLDDLYSACYNGFGVTSMKIGIDNNMTYFCSILCLQTFNFTKLGKDFL